MTAKLALLLVLPVNWYFSQNLEGNSLTPFLSLYVHSASKPAQTCKQVDLLPCASN